MKNLKYCVLFFSLFLISCEKKNTAKRQVEKYKIKVNFSIDDIKKDIDNNFVIYLVSGSDTLVIKPHNKVFIDIPDVNNQYELIFKNENNLLKFPNVPSKTIIPQQDFEWNFGIDKKPFNKYLGLMNEAEYETDKKTTEIFFLQFDPQNYGDGIQLVEKR
jgi:hypothetical protein